MILDQHRAWVLDEGGWDAVYGNDRALKLCRAMTERAVASGDSLVSVLAGPSGVGKSLTAGLMSGAWGAFGRDCHEIESKTFDVSEARALKDACTGRKLYYPPIAIVIEEADTATSNALASLLTILERLNPGVLVVLTTNLDRLAFEALPYGNALTRRAHWVDFERPQATKNGGTEPAPIINALRNALQVAGLDGQPDEWYMPFLRGVGCAVRNRNSKGDAEGLNIGKAILAAAEAAILAQ